MQMEKGVSGIVMNSKIPLNNATLTVQNYPTMKFTTQSDGKYYFYLPIGVYKITVACPMYKDLTMVYIMAVNTNYI